MNYIAALPAELVDELLLYVQPRHRYDVYHLRSVGRRRLTRSQRRNLHRCRTRAATRCIRVIQYGLEVCHRKLDRVDPQHDRHDLDGGIPQWQITYLDKYDRYQLEYECGWDFFCLNCPDGTSHRVRLRRHWTATDGSLWAHWIDEVYQGYHY